MSAIDNQKSLTKILTIGLFLVSVTVIPDGLTDPVNVPKLLLLGIFSSALVGLIVSHQLEFFKLVQSKFNLLIGFFLVFSLVAILRSDSPLSQNIYGAYGRNNGFLAYLFLSIIMFVSTLLSVRQYQLRILQSLIYVGYVNLAYCLWVILFGDFIPWNNPYGNILGTFGNPNFIGAFLGIFFGVLLAIGLGSEATRNFRVALIVLLPLTLFEIVDSSAIQGRVLAALSIGIVGIFYLYFNVSRKAAYLFSVFSTIIGFFALAGAFQKGPLTEIIYKTSVSLRGQYWLAAWNTGRDNPVSGVGMDAFGDWYRRSRDIRAIELPGVNTVVNTAHNVPLDMFAFGGWPLFISYLLLMALSLKAAFTVVRKMKSYDAVGVGLITAWTGYQVQSIISINQIGLAIWGWVLSGGLVAYSHYSPPSNPQGTGQKLIKNQKQNGVNTLKPISLIYVTIFGLIGFIISLPPVSADSKLRSAQISRNALTLEKTMQQTYFNPLNSQKFVLNIQAFESSGLFDLSHKYSQIAVKWNPEAYELWRILYLIRNSTEEERNLALENMKRLDPLNPDVTAK